MRYSSLFRHWSRILKSEGYKALARGSEYATSDRIDEAICECVPLLSNKDSHISSAARSNVAFLLDSRFEISDETLHLLENSIDWTVLSDNSSIRSRFEEFGLAVQLLRRTDSARWLRQTERYVGLMSTEEVVERRQSPILYWHIPKTAGTSLVQGISAVFYRNGSRFLPTYVFSSLLGGCIQRFPGKLPFLSSSHLPRHRFSTDGLEEWSEIMVVRDPVSRCLSAWNQYYPPHHRRVIYPQHGHLWHFFPAARLGDWARRAPWNVVNAATSTLVAYEDPVAASDTLATSRMAVLKYAGHGRQLEKAISKFVGVDIETGNARLNAAGRGIAYSQRELEILIESSMLDHQLYETIS